GYMESHDEEREMYRELQFGNSSGSYSVKTLPTAVQRMKAAAAMFYTIPGPKMLWEFGELGYDKSINTCVDQSIADSCRLTPKPVLWTYLQDQNRKSLFDHVADLIQLRKNYSVFTTTGSAQITSGSALVQQMTLKNTPYTSTPADSTQMNVQIAVNLDVVTQDVTINFPHAGTWYDYYNQDKAITGAGVALSMAPGAFKLYTDVPIKGLHVITAIADTPGTDIILYPNPAQNRLNVGMSGSIVGLRATSVTGTEITPYRVNEKEWDVSNFSSGLYIIEIQTESIVIRKKLIVK
ncbi:MAG TPA: T9SS type A sorting domain-containing protein, partial [Cyclobacteriaceae bacterium]|nr:T9SS type A sorting domain-containing protein [Cyclobacteriaceae bacterium]